MDRTELSSAIIQEMQGVVEEALATVPPEVLTADLATLEQRVQQVGRVILGGLSERVAAGHAQGLPRPARCEECHGALKRRERPRPLVGLVGDYVLHRAYYWCAACKRGAAPLDEALGLGPGDVSPCSPLSHAPRPVPNPPPLSVHCSCRAPRRELCCGAPPPLP